jgi:putative salt-induced outer membrane protein YdiY
MSIALPSWAKHKDDIVIMKNGDRFTGEIKGLARGELMFKASYMETATSLDWTKVAEIWSKDAFIVTLTDGTRVTGHLQSVTLPAGSKGIQIAATDSEQRLTQVVPQSVLIGIEQQEKTFITQLRGSFDFGFSFASDNSTSNYATSTSLQYRTYKNAYLINGSSNFDRTAGEGTARHSVDFQYQLSVSEKWYWAALTEFLHSEQQELSLRSTVGTGIGRRIIQTDRTNFSLLGGGVYTRENYSQAAFASDRSNGELLFSAYFNTFRFKTADVSATTSIFPSLSELGRIRINTDGGLKFKVARELYWKFSIYENYDSRPPVNLPKTDTGVTTSLGWSF